MMGSQSRKIPKPLYQTQTKKARPPKADNKKEQERAELHRTIWAIADEMRGSVDGWDFKSYILGMLFYRYISENISELLPGSPSSAAVAIAHQP